MRSVVRVVTLSGLLALVATGGSAQQPEPFMAVGTWKLNPAKSTGSSNQLKARSRIHTVENRGGGVAVNTIVQVNADGTTNKTYFTAKADGTPYPMISIRADGTTQVGSMTETRVDAYTVRWTITDAAGKATSSANRTVSKDGKTYTMSGGRSDGVLVYDKQ